MSSLKPAVDPIQDFYQSIATERMAHAYLIVGRPDTSGRAFAESALKYLFCDAAEPPCDSCPVCRQISEHLHADVSWLEPESKSRVITIEQIRTLNNRLAQTSFVGGWKAGIIVHADRMNNAAANAFLKTLEEPTGDSLLLLLTSAPQALLPTVVSRCQRIILPEVIDVYESSWSGALREIMADCGSGRALAEVVLSRRLDALLAGEAAEIRSNLESEEEASGQPLDEGVLAARIEGKLREVRSEIMHSILLWQRDVLFMVMDVDKDLIHHCSNIDEIERQAKNVDYRGALSRLQAIEKMIQRLDRNLRPLPVFEAGLSALT